MPAPAFVLPARFAFDARSGRLRRTTSAEVIVMLPWPVMKAFRWTTPTAAPVACTPEFVIPPELPDQSGRTDANSDDARPLRGVAHKDLPEIRAFCETIPAPVRLAVSVFRERQWQLLAWISSTGPTAEQLLQANPALAFAVACGDELSVWEAPIRFIEIRPRMAYHGQVELLARLGFPATERTRRIVRKIDAGAISLRRLRKLREWLRDAGIARRLAHLPKVNESVLALLENNTFAAVNDTVLHQLARGQDIDATDVAGRIEEAVRQWGEVRPTTPLPQFTGVDQIREVHAELRQDVSTVRRDTEHFPLPPVPGNEHIVAIQSRAMLLEEKWLQSNCVDTYASDIRKGKLAIYRVLAPQRCTLSIRLRRGRWVIGELKGTANSSASAETVAAVRRWLKGQGGSPPKTTPSRPVGSASGSAPTGSART